jgi:protein O-GlcNAc transferase
VTNTELLSALDKALADDNLALAEALAQTILADDPDNNMACAIMAHVARQIGLADAAPAWLKRADVAVLNAIPPPRNDQVRMLLNGCGPSPDDERFLVIRAWGFGFWADTMHVLGGLLLANLTGRIPCVLWGRNSLFLPEQEENAFPLFFNSIGSEFLAFVTTAPSDRIFPGKWSGRDIAGAAIDAYLAPHMGGEGKMAAIWLLNRPERIVVSDFFIGLADLLPWIPKGHRWHGQSLDQIVRGLIDDHLAPNWRIRDAVAAAREELSGQKTIAVHIRGGDKAVELSRLDELNTHYQPIVAQAVEHGYAVWLMTDTVQIVESFRARFGNAIHCLDALRTATKSGVHYSSGVEDRIRLGEEVVTDVLVGASCDRFVGNGASAPSCMVDFLMDGDETRKHLFLPNQFRRRLLSLYRD